MSKGEVTREEMLEILDDEITQTRAGLRLARGIKAGSSIDAWKRQGIVLQAIRLLIEQGKPRVGREFMDEWCGEDEECYRFIETILLQAGVEVEK